MKFSISEKRKMNYTFKTKKVDLMLETVFKTAKCIDKNPTSFSPTHVMAP